jgi:hypothetical protein
MAKFLTYRYTRLGLSVLLFVLAVTAAALFREADHATTKMLFLLNQKWSDAYPEREGEPASDLRVIDLGLERNDRTTTIKQKCAEVLDSLSNHGAAAIAVDIYFEGLPYDTSGRGALLKNARQCQNAVFAYKFTNRPEKPSALLARHALPYSQNQNEEVQNWRSPAGRELYGVQMPLAGLAEAAAHAGYSDLFEEESGYCRFYPLLRRLNDDGALFVSLAAQVWRVWLDSQQGHEALLQDSLEHVLDAFARSGLAWRPDGSIKMRRIAHSRLQPVRLQEIEEMGKGYAHFDFTGKLVLIVNSPTEEEEACNETYAGWRIHAAAISQLLEPQAGLYALSWFFLFAGYMAWVGVRLWPSEFARQHGAWRKWARLGLFAVLITLPYVLRAPSMLSDAPVWSLAIFGLALLLFEWAEQRLLKLPAIVFRDLELVYEDAANGGLQVSAVQAPVQIGKRSRFELRLVEAKPWENYKLPNYLTEAAAMRLQGEALYQFLLAGEVGNLFTASLEQVVHENKFGKARVMLRVKARNQSQKFSGLPFEILRNKEKNYGYLARHEYVSLVRDLTADPGRALQWQPPLRLLVLTASPKEYGFGKLDLAAEKNKIVQSTRLLRRKGWLRLHTLDHVTPGRLEKMRAGRFDLIHFVGHGTIAAQTQSNCLVLEDAEHHAALADADYLGQLLRRFSPQLVFLNACKTGEGAEEGVFINMARELERTTGAVVIAHQYQISDYGGVVFGETFYRVFAETLSPEFALNRARQELSATRDALASDWASPVYFVQ